MIGAQIGRKGVRRLPATEPPSVGQPSSDFRFHVDWDSFHPGTVTERLPKRSVDAMAVFLRIALQQDGALKICCISNPLWHGLGQKKGHARLARHGIRVLVAILGNVCIRTHAPPMTFAQWLWIPAGRTKRLP